MDPVWIALAFVLGFASRQMGLPPLVGYLAAGFALKAMGVEGGDTLEYIADLGVKLLLFTIGLKLRVSSLLRPEVWGTASSHMAITVLAFGAGLLALGAAGMASFDSLGVRRAALIAFALSFSSTVFAVKVLDDKAEAATRHGRVAIGILIMQDLFAVVFLAISDDKTPSLWAFALLGLLLARPLILKIMTRCGHGELLMLFGVLMTFLGVKSFDVVGLKGDLGALVFGVLLAQHVKATELSKLLMGFKDLFLVGFFLSVGMEDTPELSHLGIAGLFVLVLPVKVALFFVLLTRLRLRARTSLLTSLCLANYSEFGLIVANLGVDAGWIDGDWLVIIAISVAATFVLAAPLNNAAHAIYARIDTRLKRYETRTRLPDDQPVDPGDAEVVIFGMGGVGTSAYETLRARYGRHVVGIDSDVETVRAHRAAGRRVVLGDATDAEFWERVRPSASIRLILLAMTNHHETMRAVEQLSTHGFKGIVAATARFADEVAALKNAGVQAAFDLHGEAGAGFAQHADAKLREESG